MFQNKILKPKTYNYTFDIDYNKQHINTINSNICNNNIIDSGVTLYNYNELHELYKNQQLIFNKIIQNYKKTLLIFFTLFSIINISIILYIISII